MKFNQLIEYNMKNIFVEKSFTKCGEEAISGTFSKKSKWVCLWINSLKILYSLFLLYANLRVIKI